MADMGQRDGIGDADATFVFLLEDNIWRVLVDSDTKALELSLDNSFVSEGLVDVEDNEDKMARFGNGDDLTASTFAVLGSLDDTGQIKHLDSSAVVLDLTRYSG